MLLVSILFVFMDSCCQISISTNDSVSSICGKVFFINVGSLNLFFRFFIPCSCGLPCVFNMFRHINSRMWLLIEVAFRSPIIRDIWRLQWSAGTKYWTPAFRISSGSVAGCAVSTLGAEEWPPRSESWVRSARSTAQRLKSVFGGIRNVLHLLFWRSSPFLVGSPVLDRSQFFNWYVSV